jgi:hypothetical protein
MKKLLGILLLAFWSFTSYSQTTSDNGFHFGLKAAPSLAWLKTDDKEVTSNGSKLGFTYGLITEFNFADNYAFATGLDICYRGGKLKSQSTIKNGAGVDSVTMISEATYNLQYIEIPVTLKLKTNEIGYLTYYLQAGIAPGLNIRARASGKTSYQSLISGVPTPNPEEIDNIDVKDDINTLNVSMIIGGGIEYTLSGTTVMLAGIEFSNGFLDVIDGDEIKANSNYLALKLGILF